jgi:2-polyprenyl-6-methoxyphenol hydroxylase-like FAD-dependent oxidoreductase
MQMQVIHTTCCVVGGGPAGMMLGLLMARAGVDVIVVEKHGSFVHEFRSDTIHPGTLQVMHELGLLEEFLTLPHERAGQLSAQIGNETMTLADFSHLPGPCRFMAFMPQRDFLDFLARHARQSPLFRLQMKSEVTGLVEDGDRVVGVTLRTDRGMQQVRARVVIAADGRHSAVREAAGMAVEDLGASADMLSFTLPRLASDSTDAFGRYDVGKLLMLVNQGSQWQCGLVIPRGTLPDRQHAGLDAFRAEIAALQPFLADRVDRLRSWNDIALLPVEVNRLRQWWRSGLLCIGDAAHGMSPVGGVGINLAIQDAVATANILAPHLRTCLADDEDLAAVQKRREWPVRVTQNLQLLIQDKLVPPCEGAAEPIRLPRAIRKAASLPLLRRIPAHLIGMGFRPEHVQERVN